MPDITQEQAAYLINAGEVRSINERSGVAPLVSYINRQWVLIDEQVLRDQLGEDFAQALGYLLHPDSLDGKRALRYEPQGHRPGLYNIFSGIPPVSEQQRAEYNRMRD